MNDIKYLQRNFIKEDGKLLILSLTKYCNLACKYCKTKENYTYDKLSSISDKAHFPNSKFEEIKRICLINNIREVTLTGGEPTEYPFFFEILTFFIENKIRFSLHTNGVSNKWKKILFFFTSNKLYPDIHLSVELVNSLQEDIRGTFIPFDLIKKLRKIGCNIELKITIHQKVLPYLSDLEEILNNFIDKDIVSMRIQPVFFPNNVDSNIKLNEQGSAIFKKLLELKGKEKFSSFIRNSKENLLLIIKMLEEKDLSKIEKPKCIAKDKIIFMQPDGKTINCLQLWGKLDCERNFDLVCCGFVA